MQLNLLCVHSPNVFETRLNDSTANAAVTNDSADDERFSMAPLQISGDVV